MLFGEMDATKRFLPIILLTDFFGEARVWTYFWVDFFLDRQDSKNRQESGLRENDM